MDAAAHLPIAADQPMSRLIPSSVKHEVFKRDRGRCVICGATDYLHFDHELPYSRGGAGITADNVRILCARHNLSKGARIE
jgi:5-methylcytosine-specific restriction endonuclease McrA